MNVITPPLKKPKMANSSIGVPHYGSQHPIAMVNPSNITNTTNTAAANIFNIVNCSVPTSSSSAVPTLTNQLYSAVPRSRNTNQTYNTNCNVSSCVTPVIVYGFMNGPSPIHGQSAQGSVSTSDAQKLLQHLHQIQQLQQLQQMRQMQQVQQSRQMQACLARIPSSDDLPVAVNRLCGHCNRPAPVNQQRNYTTARSPYSTVDNLTMSNDVGNAFLRNLISAPSVCPSAVNLQMQTVHLPPLEREEDVVNETRAVPMAASLPDHSEDEDLDSASCHQCKVKKAVTVLLYCTKTRPCSGRRSKTKRCRKKFCKSCMTKYFVESYVENLLRIKNEEKFKFDCPACIGLCSCSACKRKRNTSKT